VAVAVGADVRIGAVDVLEPRDVRPHVANPDREQQPPRHHTLAPFERQAELLVGAAFRAQYDRVDQLDAERAADFPSARAKLGRPHALEPEIAVNAAGFPVAWIAAVDERDAVEIARRPDRSAQPGGTTAHDADVERRSRSLRHAAVNRKKVSGTSRAQRDAFRRYGSAPGGS